MVTPLIGLTGRRKLGADISGTIRAMRAAPFDIHVHAYSHAIAAHGGLPVQLPMVIDADAAVSRLDGLVLTGGADVDPARYGALRDPATTRVEPERDVFELALLEAARRRGIPILGICRGCQLINVAFGGTLHQHVPAHARFAGDPDEVAHGVRVVPGSNLALAYNRAGAPDHVVPVNSLHHQVLDRIGHDLVVTGRAGDGVVEAIEHPTEAIVAVQWHPELLAHPQPLFRWLVDRAATRPPR